jgi:hypothetical protein
VEAPTAHIRLVRQGRLQQVKSDHPACAFVAQPRQEGSSDASQPTTS